MSDTRRVIHTTRAKSEGERLAHQETHRAFLQDVLSDSRTRDLYARWVDATGLDQAISGYVAGLDLAAMVFDLPHRSLLYRSQAVLERLPSSTVEALTRLETSVDRIMEDTRDARAAEAIAFVRGDLFHDPETPVCAWLGHDLLELFDREVHARIWDERSRVGVLLSPVRGPVPKGQRPKRGGEHLARNAHWLYRARVALNPTPIPQLAEEYAAEMKAKGINLEPKKSHAKAAATRGGHVEYRDDSLVRRGIDDAWRLLTLPIPPQDWVREYFKPQR